MKVKVNESKGWFAYHLCEFCHVETTAPLLYIEIEGFDLDICPTCYHSLDHGERKSTASRAGRGEEE